MSRCAYLRIFWQACRATGVALYFIAPRTASYYADFNVADDLFYVLFKTSIVALFADIDIK